MINRYFNLLSVFVVFFSPISVYEVYRGLAWVGGCDKGVEGKGGGMWVREVEGEEGKGGGRMRVKKGFPNSVTQTSAPAGSSHR